MKKIIYICDKCGKQLTDEIFPIGKLFDLCPECADKFQNVLAGFQNQEEEQPKPESKKRGGARRKIKLDLGKVGALYLAGWSVIQIAEEMNCSDQTIRNHLNEAVKVYKSKISTEDRYEESLKEENDEQT